MSALSLAEAVSAFSLADLRERRVFLVEEGAKTYGSYDEFVLKAKNKLKSITFIVSVRVSAGGD